MPRFNFILMLPHFFFFFFNGSDLGVGVPRFNFLLMLPHFFFFFFNGSDLGVTPKPEPNIRVFI